ncbi:MAG TPA: CYTH domain-containing protein [Chiayiivirga sp.]|nr:MAG: CYTH domain-containing protein [Ottowia sp.]HPA01233.1 CYTH domain-containing protein [Chiayiivirga sp.]
MPIEIERKFLPANDAWRARVARSQRMAQGYLNDARAVREGAQNVSMRVRIAGQDAHLNLKSRELGAYRQEFEYPIPLADAEALLALCVGGCIEKLRHHVRHGAHEWEIDEFFGENAGLVVAEIELSAVDEEFEKPDWLGAEVTDKPRYYNLTLAERPYSQWTSEEKTACS